MFDIISVILSIISILQNLKHKKSTEEVILDLIQILKQTDSFYELLLKAKNSHDEFEKFDAAAVEPLVKFIEDKNVPQKVIKNELSSFIKLSLIMIKDLDTDEINLLPSAGETKNVPSNIALNLKNIYKVNVKYLDSLKAFHKHTKKLKELTDINNYGDDLDKCIYYIQFSVHEIRASADDLILNITPILAFIHFETRKVLEELNAI